VLLPETSCGLSRFDSVLVELAPRLLLLRLAERPFYLRHPMFQALHPSRIRVLLPSCPLANRPKIDDLAHAPPNFVVAQAYALFPLNAPIARLFGSPTGIVSDLNKLLATHYRALLVQFPNCRGV